jgi:hypothetical protein
VADVPVAEMSERWSHVKRGGSGLASGFGGGSMRAGCGDGLLSYSAAAMRPAASRSGRSSGGGDEISCSSLFALASASLKLQDKKHGRAHR